VYKVFRVSFSVKEKLNVHQDAVEKSHFTEISEFFTGISYLALDAGPLRILKKSVT
jgi:hypothetical protein